MLTLTAVQGNEYNEKDQDKKKSLDLQLSKRASTGNKKSPVVKTFEGDLQLIGNNPVGDTTKKLQNVRLKLEFYDWLIPNPLFEYYVNNKLEFVLYKLVYFIFIWIFHISLPYSWYLLGPSKKIRIGYVLGWAE